MKIELKDVPLEKESWSVDMQQRFYDDIQVNDAKNSAFLLTKTTYYELINDG